MGSLNPLNLISQIALAVVTGGTSMLLQAAIKAVISAVGEQIIQQLGQTLGLPQGIIDMAKGVFNTAMGNASGASQGINGAVGELGKLTNASAFQTGQMEKTAGAAVTTAVDMFKDAIKYDRAAVDENGGQKSKTTKTAAGQSWLMAIAELLGSKLNQAAEELKTKADATDWKDGKSMSEFNALTQQFNTLMSSVNTTIKSIGEALTSQARKS